MNAIIIDDENKARQLLKTILVEYCPQIKEVYDAEDLLLGVASIKKHKPDVVFLDIEMPEYSGLQILDFIDQKDFDFEIIFTTAYSEYAIKAFKFSAIDYLMKPLRPKQIQEAIIKLEKQVKKNRVYDKLQELCYAFKSNSFAKIALPTGEGVHFFDIENIICFKADGMYTRVFSISEDSLLISRPLKYFADLLAERTSFYRPHRSFLINLKHIQQFVKKDGSYLLMKRDIVVSISKEKREEFLSFVNTI
ncbi:LytR/AlgR family response regulator transcription factor [Flavivirga eckloniae]|uniref:DNA-binding response regulator n=1 Tax=Flavivirga eckloniae TaxID=1803846 RepID=A0A2K9PLJ4_9FLAO|nr:LytTR family DNA-binding domain-containing protein [Flavivirga eckloniae]AUP77922.1 DNA-binding response regulator [Flavivirga eckloniae]